MKDFALYAFLIFLAAWFTFILSSAKRYVQHRSILLPICGLLCMLPLAPYMPSLLIIGGASYLVLLHTKGMSRLTSDSAWSSHPLFVVVFLLCAFEFSFFCTYGSFNIIGKESFGSSYDWLGYNLLSARADIAPRAIKWEAFLVKGRSYMYFGPMPAFLRIFLNAFSTSQFGNWSRFSVFLAALFALSACTLIVHRELAKITACSSAFRFKILILCLIGFGIGTPLLFLTSCSFIYHEANIWAFCWACWGIYFLIPLLDEDMNSKESSPRYFAHLFFFSLSAGFTLLSRVTFSIPLFLILSIIGLLFALKRTYSIKQFILASMPAVLAFTMQLWYNNQRFESPFIFTDFHLYHALIDPQKESVFDIGGLFNIIRIPFAFKQYFLHFGDTFFTDTPFVQAHTAQGFIPHTYPHPFRHGPQMRLISFPLVSPWLLFTAFPGLCALFLRGRNIWRICAVLFTVQVIMILAYYWVCQRYMSEFLPLFILGTVFFIRFYVEKISLKSKRLFLLTFTSLVLYSVSTTFLSTIEYVSTYRDGVPEGYPEKLKEEFKSFDAALAAF